MIAGGFTCQRYGFNVGADKFSLLTIENGKNKHYAPIGMDIDFPKPKISLRQAASEEKMCHMYTFSLFFLILTAFFL